MQRRQESRAGISHFSIGKEGGAESKVKYISYILPLPLHTTEIYDPYLPKFLSILSSRRSNM